MKKERNKEGKKILMIFILAFMAVFIISTVSAGWFQELRDAISGRATQNVEMNITVGAPQIITVFNDTIDVSNGPDEYPNATTIIIVNFSVNTVSGVSNLNNDSAAVNVSGDAERSNSSCQMYDYGTDNANYTCIIGLQWWDGSGDWNITAYIEDNQGNAVTNSSTKFYVGSRTAFVMGPSALTWTALAPGATNQTSNNDPLLLNNTGNDEIVASSITINSSNLRGETAPAEGLWAENFSVSWTTGGAACSAEGCTECGGTQMARSAFTALDTANLTKGNFTIDDKSTGQEELYFCLRYVGSEISTQSYSTANETEWAWIVQIA